jgi:hypothetical protein
MTVPAMAERIPPKRGEDLGDGLWRFVALAVAVAGLVLRVAAARGTHLVGDEALDFQMANYPRIVDLYDSTLGNAHPPLFFLLLRFWLPLGRSEMSLRLLPVLCGALLTWVAYRWASELHGRSAGLSMLVLAAFSPALVSLSAQLRGYTLLLLLAAASALSFEKAMRMRSAGWMVASSVFLCLALLTHYSAIFFAAALFVYAAIRVARSVARGMPARLRKTWMVSQLAFGAVMGFLAITHVAHLRGSDLEREVKTRMLRPEYFQAEQDQALTFLVRQTGAVFRFLCGSPARGLAAFVLAVAGVLLLVARREPSAALLSIPFVLNAVAALLGLYPYGGVRQSVYLGLFAFAAIGAAVAAGVTGRPRATIAVVVLIALVLLTNVLPMRKGESKSQMNAVIGKLQEDAVPGSLVFVDRRAGAVLDYYLGRNDRSTERPGREGFRESSAGGYRIFESPIWNFTAASFGGELERFRKVYGLPARAVVWVFNVESRVDFQAEVSRRFPEASLPPSIRSGGISLFAAVLP